MAQAVYPNKARPVPSVSSIIYEVFVCHFPPPARHAPADTGSIFYALLFGTPSVHYSSISKEQNAVRSLHTLRSLCLFETVLQRSIKRRVRRVISWVSFGDLARPSIFLRNEPTAAY